VIGTEASGREQAQTTGLIGPFANNLVLRTDCSGDPSFGELLQRVLRVWNDAHQHRGLTFETLLENLHVRRDLSRNPLFQVMFAHREALDTVTAAQATFVPYAMETGSEPLDLTVTVFENAHACEARFSYSVDLFSDATIERMIGHFQTLLEGIVADPACKLSALPLLTSAEKRQILLDWNNTAVAYPRDVALNTFIEQQVERTPDSIALVYESERLTYRQINNRANQLAHALRKHGVGPDVLVGVCAERSVEMVIALLATIKAGGGYVPLDPEYPSERLETMLTDANPAVVLTQQHVSDRLAKTERPTICLDRDWQSIATESTDNPPVTAAGNNIAYAIYTSGSTGKPKGVPNTHDGIVNRLLWMQDMYQLTGADSVLQKTPYSFDVSVWEFFWPLMAGARLVVAKPGGHKDPAYLVDLINQEKITTLHFVPSMLTIFLEADGVERCRSIRQVFASGEALPYELQQRFFERLNAELHNLYGPTEAAVDVTYWRCRPDGEQAIVPIGRPIANTQIYILDAHLQPVPIGVAGELHIGGRGLARGYLNRLELSAEKFIRDPFSSDPAARLYKTGDLARFLADSNIEYLGRIDHQVKLRGFRIELGEIESVLSEDASVRQAVVTVREDIPGDKRLVAYVVPAFGDNPDFDKLRDRAKSKLPEYMVPSKFVLLEKLPMTSSGKVDRNALPAPQTEQKDHAVVEPRTELEALLVNIYRNILGVQLVGVTDDFFDLGGHSLMAARMLSEVRHATGKKIPLALLFRGASPEFLASVIEQGVEMPAEPIAMLIQSGDALPPFFTVVPPGENAVGYMKLARHVGPHQPFYKLQEPGPAPLDRPYTRAEMQELANKYVDAMRAVQPVGPYYFGGLCDGAHIGFRMAQRLEQQGHEIGMFAIFDTWVLENSQRHILWLIDYYSQRYQHFRKLSWIEQFRTLTRNLRKLSNKALGRRPERSAWAEAYWPEDNFVTPTINGRVTLFKRPKQPYYRLRDPEMGWGARAAGGVDIQVLPIDHEEMLREPHVQILARRVRERLLDYYAAGEKEKLNAYKSCAAVGSESEVS
jgi:amino acid adenylation domain-containing protein